MKYTNALSKLRFILLITLLLASHSFFGQGDLGEEMETSVLRTYMDKDLQWGPCPSFMPEGCNITVLHGDPAKENVDIFFKVPPNYEIPEHWHTSVERMILVSGELHVTYEGEENRIMKVGSYAFGPAKKPHIAKCAGKDPCVLFIAFEKPLDAFPMAVTEKEME